MKKKTLIFFFARKSAGFTLVEIMIAVAIIAVLVAISIPSILRSRLIANETDAIQAVRTIHSAEAIYRISNPTYADIFTLATSTPPYIIGFTPPFGVFAFKKAYIFTVNNISADRYTVFGFPRSYGKTGVRSFRCNETGAIQYCTAEPAYCFFSTDDWKFLGR